MQVTWPKEKRQIGSPMKIACGSMDLESIESSNHARVLNGSYNGPDLTRRNASGASHRDPTAAVLMRFITHIDVASSERSIKDRTIAI